MKKGGYLTLASKKSLLRRKLAILTFTLAMAIFMSGAVFAFNSSGRLDIEGSVEIVFSHDVLQLDALIAGSALGAATYHYDHEDYADNKEVDGKAADEVYENLENDADFEHEIEIATETDADVVVVTDTATDTAVEAVSNETY